MVKKWREWVVAALLSGDGKLPWWMAVLVAAGVLVAAVAIFLILCKTGVFRTPTDETVLAIRNRASIDATIASVRAVEKTEDGKKSVAEAKRRDRLAAMRQKAKEVRALPPEERAAVLEEKAQAEAEKAERILARSEALRERAEKMKMRGDAKSENITATEQEATENKTEKGE